jgi:hypothetical protein
MSIWNYAILKFFLLLSSSCGHLTFDIHLFLIFFIYTDSIELNFFNFIYFEFFCFSLSLFLFSSSLLTLRWLSDGPSNVPVSVPVGDASQLCITFARVWRYIKTYKYLPSCLVTYQQLAPTEDAAF